MSQFLLKAAGKVIRMMIRLDSTIPASLAVHIQNIQGKGSGVSSVEVEAKMAIGFLIRSGIKNPMVLDVGANIGKYSEVILKVSPQATIFAFEPSTFARNQLVERITGRGISDLSYHFRCISSCYIKLWWLFIRGSAFSGVGLVEGIITKKITNPFLVIVSGILLGSFGYIVAITLLAFLAIDFSTRFRRNSQSRKGLVSPFLFSLSATFSYGIALA